MLNQIKLDRLQARKDRDGVKGPLLTTLISEIEMVAKNANRGVTNDDVTKVVQKFLKGVNETVELLKSKSEDIRYANAIEERKILESYLPKMASDDDVREAVRRMGDVQNVGQIMKALKETFGAALDGKRASQIVKEMQC